MHKRMQRTYEIPSFKLQLYFFPTLIKEQNSSYMQLRGKMLVLGFVYRLPLKTHNKNFAISYCLFNKGR